MCCSVFNGMLSQGYSTPFLSIGSTYMYTSLSVVKQAVLAVGEELKSSGLPPEICPLVFVFTGTGNVSGGAQEILNLLPHEYVDPSWLHKLRHIPFKGGVGAAAEVDARTKEILMLIICLSSPSLNSPLHINSFLRIPPA